MFTKDNTMLKSSRVITPESNLSYDLNESYNTFFITFIYGPSSPGISNSSSSPGVSNRSSAK